MRRVRNLPRPDWQQEVEKWGMVYHTHEGKPYWYESAYYVFDSKDVERIESATNELHSMCLEVVASVVKSGDYERLQIPAATISAIEKSWTVRQPSLYGRFDFAYDGKNSPKLLEYNADTPTALLEAAVVQWQWSQSVLPGVDQFNLIWEALVARWKELKGEWISGDLIHFAHDESDEDTMTVSLLRDTAVEAGFKTDGILMSDIGWNESKHKFVDVNDQPMNAIFKLYPWEWIVKEGFGQNALSSYTGHFWIEPIWKMILSNKAMLAILWEKYPNHPNLLPAFFGEPNGLTSYAKKPLLSREGSNISLVLAGQTLEETGGDYGAEGFVFQQLAELAEFDGNYPIIGSWVVGDESCGVGVRESDGRITTDLSRFVPNIIQG
jgi:glutathionylspermidine synthase